jgi:hypothetical protein
MGGGGRAQIHHRHLYIQPRKAAQEGLCFSCSSGILLGGIWGVGWGGCCTVAKEAICIWCPLLAAAQQSAVLAPPCLFNTLERCAPDLLATLQLQAWEQVVTLTRSDKANMVESVGGLRK